MTATATLTLAGPARHQLEVKHSRFVAYAEPAVSVEAALAAIARHSEPTATHNCWAYRVGSAYRFNDDGEPGGTAGRPILMAIDGQKLDRVAVLVVRHYGGIKLGAGGLARAYGGCAAECLRQAYKTPIIHTIKLCISCDFSQYAQVRELLARCGTTQPVERFEPEGVTLAFEAPAGSIATLGSELAAVSRGTIKLRTTTD